MKNIKGNCNFLSHNYDFFLTIVSFARWKVRIVRYKVRITWYKVAIAR